MNTEFSFQAASPAGCDESTWAWLRETMTSAEAIAWCEATPTPPAAPAATKPRKRKWFLVEAGDEITAPLWGTEVAKYGRIEVERDIDGVTFNAGSFLNQHHGYGPTRDAAVADLIQGAEKA